MKRVLASVLATLFHAYAYGQAVDGIGGVGGFKTVGSCSQSVAYFGRATASHSSGDALDTFICIGLVGNNLWTKMDVVYVFAQPNSTDALRNLKSTSFTGTANGSPSFSANNGFTGVDASSTVYIDTGFNASTAGGNYAQNSAHLSVWDLTGAISSASGGTAIGMTDGTNMTQLAPYYSDSTSTAFINSLNGGAANFTDTTAVGHYVGVRTSSSAEAIFKNGVSQNASAPASTALQNLNTFVLARNHNGAGESGGGRQVAIATIGAQLSAADISNLCHAENVYLTAVAGISGGTC